jgi:hypothetical protein
MSGAMSQSRSLDETVDFLAGLRAAWLRTMISIRLNGRTVDIDDPDLVKERALLAPFDLPVTVITAWNPDGRPCSSKLNRANNALLHRHLAERYRNLRAAVGRSRDGAWREPGFAVDGLDESGARSLARVWRQLAVFQITATEVVVLSVDGSFRDRRRRGQIDRETAR